MYSKLLLLLTTLILAATLWTSCDDRQTCDCDPPPPTGIGAIQIVTSSANDTMYFLPNDSAFVTVTVIVTDWNGRPYPGAKVDVSLSDSSLGVLEFSDPVLHDTTNALGRVNMVYFAYAQAGDQIITATAGGITATRTLVIREAGTLPTSLTLIVTPQLLEVDSNQLDSARVDITLVDGDNRGVPNVAINPTVTGGVIQIPQVTDSSGRASCNWYFYNDFGTFQLNIGVGAIHDSAQVEVRLREVESPQYVVHLTWPHDTVTFLPGDSVTFPFVAHVANEQGQRVPGVRVDFTVQNPMLGMINFTNPQLRDTTDAVGQVGLEFLSFATPGDLVVSACVGDSCDYMTVALREIVHEPPQVSIHTIPATLHVDSNTVGEAFILVVAQDNNGILLPGITPTITVEAGEFDPPPPTNANGESQTSWRFFNQYGAFGVTATIEVNNQFATDSTTINVLYGP